MRKTQEAQSGCRRDLGVGCVMVRDIGQPLIIVRTAV